MVEPRPDKLKVVHVVDALGLGGGAEHSLAALLPELDRRGVVSEVICLYPRKGGLEARLRSLGYSVAVLPQRTLAAKAFGLRRHIKLADADVVHATLARARLISAMALLGVRIPQIHSVVNATYDEVRLTRGHTRRWKLAVVRSLDQVVLARLVQHVHAITAAVKQEVVRELGVSPSRVSVIPRGRLASDFQRSDAERSKVRAELGVSEEAFVLLSVGRQDPQKAHVDLVRVMPVVVDRVPEAVLVLAGREGTATAEIRHAIRELSLDNAVRLLGHRDDVSGLYSAADVFVFPSAFEGLGGALLEAMACQVPVVASDVPAVREVLAAGAAGRLVRRGDADRLAAAILELATDPGERSRLSIAGYERFLQAYELAHVADATTAMYRQVAKLQLPSSRAWASWRTGVRQTE